MCIGDLGVSRSSIYFFYSTTRQSKKTQPTTPTLHSSMRSQPRAYTYTPMHKCGVPFGGSLSLPQFGGVWLFYFRAASFPPGWQRAFAFLATFTTTNLSPSLPRRRHQFSVPLPSQSYDDGDDAHVIISAVHTTRTLLSGRRFCCGPIALRFERVCFCMCLCGEAGEKWQRAGPLRCACTAVAGSERRQM